MNNFGALYWFEFRKIMKNRVTLVTFLFFMVLSGIMGIGQTSLREGDSAMAGYRKIDGRLVDDALMEEMINAADEYGVAWTLSNMAYDPLCYWVRGIVGYGTPLADHNAEEIYQKRIDGIQDTQIISRLTERELEFWAEKEKMVRKPFTWRVTAFPQALLSGVSYNMIVLLFLVTISLSMIFAGEMQARTAPMIFTL